MTLHSESKSVVMASHCFSYLSVSSPLCFKCHMYPSRLLCFPFESLPCDPVTDFSISTTALCHRSHVRLAQCQQCPCHPSGLAVSGRTESQPLFHQKVRTGRRQRVNFGNQCDRNTSSYPLQVFYKSSWATNFR